MQVNLFLPMADSVPSCVYGSKHTQFTVDTFNVIVAGDVTDLPLVVHLPGSKAKLDVIFVSDNHGILRMKIFSTIIITLAAVSTGYCQFQKEGVLYLKNGSALRGRFTWPADTVMLETYYAPRISHRTA